MATPVEKQNDYNFLKTHSGLGRYAPEQLADYTTLEMSATDIDRLFQKDLDNAIAVARNTFTEAEFDKFPVTCQAALIDIAYNCGGFSTFGTIVMAVKGEGAYAGKPWGERWLAAALHSRRGQVSAQRNDQIDQWLRAAASAGP